jgi:outer membrane receptor protein involved in Fe transport
MQRGLFLILVILCAQLAAPAQTGEIHGRLTDASNGEPLVGATVLLVGTRIGATTDTEGSYVLAGLEAGTYTLRAAYVGFVTLQKIVRVTTDPVAVDFSMTPTIIEQGEVIVEVNRARERETPVAFSNVDKLTIETRIHGQDAPLLVQGTPGVYTYSTDGVGNGEAKVFVRGFNQNYVQVLVNGVPTNDPESNSVYWSNWGSVSAAAASIQIQRGAGSSLYGAGSFGGSFNIVTADAPPQPYIGTNLTFGSPLSSLYGIQVNSGLIDNKFAATFRLDRKVAEGSRISGRYEGINYYGSLAWYITPQQSLKFVLHGAPQEHGYSFTNDISYFKKFGYEANSAPFLPRYVVEALPVNPSSGAPHYGLLDGSRELVDPNYVNLSHNFYHKAQAELHYRFDLNPVSAITATLFYSRGRGGGSSLNSSGTVFRRNSNGTLLSLVGSDGTVVDPAVVINTYLLNAFQRISYSFHQQGGILASYDTRLTDWAKVTLGGEFRSWTADHPGHYVNLYGKTSVTTRYARRDTTGRIGNFDRRVYQGDLDGPESDIGNIFGWNMAGALDPTYRTQYRNYRGETPQYTIFGQGIWTLGPVSLTTSIQYVWYSYKLTENMPSENAIGQQLTTAEVASRGITSEGPTGSGTFLMRGTDNRWYEVPLVNETRSRGFLQPKFGLNCNVSENLNFFGNFAHVERFVDLGVYYNQGRVDPTVEDEKSDQFELGAGWTSPLVRAKLNGYLMKWDNKAARIQDISKAGQPGYDRNGYRSELVGTSDHKGIEAEVALDLGELFGARGLLLTGAFTWMENKWTEVLPGVLTDPNTGARRAFNTSALNAAGAVDTLFFDELTGTPVASGPQTMLSVGLSYDNGSSFAGCTINYFARQLLLDGGSYMAVDGGFAFDGANRLFVPIFDRSLPNRAVVNANCGTRFDLFGLKAAASVQILNVLNTEYLEDVDRFGVLPGLSRAVRLNLMAGV